MADYQALIVSRARLVVKSAAQLVVDLVALAAGVEHVLVPFAPLGVSVVAKTATTLIAKLSRTGGTLVVSQVIIRINGLLVYGVGADPGNPAAAAWEPTVYSGSTIVDNGDGTFNFSVIRANDWLVGVAYNVLFDLPTA